ncbi:hypothetical protein VQL36_15030 [Chengkuizengella sp. SCS-71B]|uniref:hypothetical protein n=1 Tax=Chengkuizengella sp. SCS-71B TaxID=3115290 RepID=UPI0032C2356E
MKKYIFVLTIAFILGVSSYAVYDKNLKFNDEAISLAKDYKTVSELYNDYQVIVKGKITEDYIERDVQLTEKIAKERVYNVKVNKLLTNNTTININKGDVILLSQTYGIEMNGEYYPLSEELKDSLGNGNYIFFLDTYEDENTGEVMYSSSQNAIFKQKGEKYKNVYGGSLPELTELEVEKEIEKEKKIK